MANPKIEVEIGAVIDGLKKGFGESVKIIETLEKQALELDKALRAATDLPTIQGLNTQLAQTKAALSQLKTSGIDPLAKATSNYNSIGTDFARIIQDAPFGIIGVGNNITQLAGSFQVLKNQTGSTGAAVKAAFGSIFSSGNALILGISALTTVFTILQQKGFFNTEEATKSLTERLEEYRETLDGITKANLEGQINAQKEISSFKLLTIQAENTNLSLQKRLLAVEELKKQYPEYLKNLTDEQILTGNVGDAYKNLTNDIIALSKAKAISAQLDKNSAEILTLRLQEDIRANEIGEKRIKLQSALNNTIDAGARVAGQFTATNDDAMLIQMEIDRLTKEQLKSAEERNKIIVQNLSLEAQIVSQNSQGANFVKEKVTVSKQLNTEKEKELELEDQIAKNVEFTNKLQQDSLKKVEALSPALLDVSTKFKDINIDFKPSDIIPQIDDSKKSAFIKSLKDFNAEASNIISSGTANTIGDVAFGIGQALANGTSVFKAAGRALLEGVAQIADGLGQAAIKVGIGMIAIKAAFKNPATAIAAGVALVALAGFIRAKIGGGGGGSIPSGGGGGSASVGGAGVGGGSSFVGGAQGGLFQQNRDVSGEFVVRGQDLVYVLGQANNRINKG